MGRSAQQESAIISIDPNVTYQTMTGWEATVGADWRDKPTLAPVWNDAALNMGVEIGLNRVRLPVWSGAENAANYFKQYLDGQITQPQYNTHRGEIINDNADPNVINTAAFTWSEVDWVIDHVVVPLRNRLAAKGEALWVNASYHGEVGQSALHRDNPTEYAEFVLAFYEHMQSAYGFIPDSWNLHNEPNQNNWTATQIGNCLRAAGDKLAASRFASNIHFIAPEELSISDSVTGFDTIWAISGVPAYLKTLGYHSYGSSDADRNKVRTRVIDNSLFSGMHEHAGADYVELHDDIVEGGVSAWQQYIWTGYQTNDTGGAYIIADAANPQEPVVLGSRTKFLRQYFKYVRIGAKRVDATSSDDAFDPLTFINRDGKYVVVIKAERGGSFSIQDLPPGTYGIKYTTPSSYDVDAADQAVESGQVLTANIPDRGVLTVYAKTSTGGQTGQAVIDRCELTQDPLGAFILNVYGANIKSGASVTVGDMSPGKVKFKAQVSPEVYTRLKLKGNICDGLPGSIIVTNPGAPPSAPFRCTSSCQ